ncbi:hypothetical protein HNO90_001472 [Staphylococcus hominis]|uniref:hypothetical protein n=1 Tax=Staphylococcus hominis TaxID=1290 RepID=UPI00160C5F21|nr:hypothetical protein [Staphylococcus hominis]MBB4833081.1 hypothetical protein [Staphylococcus hominis]
MAKIKKLIISFLSIVEKYLLTIVTIFFIIFSILNSNFGSYFHWPNLLKCVKSFFSFIDEIILMKNDIVINLSAIFIGIYVSTMLIYSSSDKTSLLSKFNKKTYIISYKYLEYALMFSFLYIFNFLLNDILYNCIIIDRYLIIMLFISFLRAIIYLAFWQGYEIRNNNNPKSLDENKFTKLENEVKNIKDILNRKK